MLAEHRAAQTRVLDEAYDVALVDENGEAIPRTTRGPDPEPIAAPVVTLAPSTTTRVSVLDAINAIRDSYRCERCGKTRALVNVAAYSHRRSYAAEAINPAIHCLCPDSPLLAHVQEAAS